MPGTDEQKVAFTQAVGKLEALRSGLQIQVSAMKQSDDKHMREGAKHFGKAVDELEKGIVEFQKMINEV